MSKLRVYLSGCVKKADDEFQSWRDECLNGFYENLKFIDPNSYFNYTDKPPKTDKQCLDLFIWQVKNCDVILVNLDHSDDSCGTCMEIEHAFCYGIPIIAFGSKPETWYSWVKERSSVIFNNLEDTLEYINESYGTI